MSTQDYTKIERNISVQNKSGRYLVRVKGKPQKTLDTLVEARLHRDSLKAGIYIEDNSKCSKLTEVWDGYIARLKQLGRAKSTLDTYKRQMRVFDPLLSMKMKDITQSFLFSFIEEKVEMALKGKENPQRCNFDNDLSRLSQVFNYYLRTDLYKYESQFIRNPVIRDIKEMGFIKPTPEKERDINIETFHKFHRKLYHPFDKIALIQYQYASRIGEVRSLKVSNINLKKRNIRFMNPLSYSEDEGVYESRFLKDKRRHKDQYIPNKMLSFFEQLINEADESSEYIFNIDGKPISYSQIKYAYNKAAKEIESEFSGTHILRHGMCKEIREVFDLDGVIAVSQHKDRKTADHYSKPVKSKNRLILEEMSERLHSAQDQEQQHPHLRLVN